MELNQQQQEARSLVHGTRDHVLISGFAGTGKTVLLRRLIQDLIEDPKRQVCVTATTGLAAQHVRGHTLAKVLGLGTAKNLHDIPEVDFRKAEIGLHKVTDMVVDEISMASGDYLELADHVMQAIRSNQEPFGGVRMIFCGDFMQLPPVRRYSDPDPEYPWAFEYPSFREVLTVFLTQSMRQTDEEEIQALNEFRQGILTARGRQILHEMNQRRLIDAVDLFPRRRDVETINHARLQMHNGTEQTYPTFVRPESRRKELLSQVSIGEEVRLKLGAPIIILTNDPDGHYVNGSQGKVIAFGRHSIHVELTTGEEVEVDSKEWEIRDPQGDFAIGRVRGLPVQLGWAATIHRSQGMTLGSIVTDVSRCWEPGQAYVALSRTRSLQNVGLLAPVEKIKADPVALAYVNSLF